MNTFLSDDKSDKYLSEDILYVQGLTHPNLTLVAKAVVKLALQILRLAYINQMGQIWNQH